MPGNKKLAIFDFDGTIYKYQSPDRFSDFAAPNNPRTWILQLMCFGINTWLKQYWVKHKKLKLSKIKGMPLRQLQVKSVEFVDTLVMNNLIPVVEAELKKFISDPEYDVVIASAGYNIYLEYFNQRMNIPYLIATRVELNNNVATGKWVGADCYDYNKVNRLKEVFNLEEYDLKNSVCYSDSMSDKPLFDLVGNKFFVKQVGEDYVINKL